MKQLLLILERLKKPSVLLSIASQIVTLLMLFNVKVDMNLVTGIITAITAILVLLGIVSNPTTKTGSYGDDILDCSLCGKQTAHVLINGKMVCSECGGVYEEKTA